MLINIITHAHESYMKRAYDYLCKLKIIPKKIHEYDNKLRICADKLTPLNCVTECYEFSDSRNTPF